jgi:hypothetical protein
MNVYTRFAVAAAFAAAFGTAAAAEEWTGPRVVGTGQNASVVYSSPSQNIVGGALTRTVGSGESAEVVVLDAQQAQAGRVARVVGSGENLSVVTDAPATQALMAKAGEQG